MTIRELCAQAGFTPLALPDPEHEVDGCYVGDLLSWVMGNAEPNCVWVTIMTNRNIIAVSALIDMGAILLAEGCTITDELVALANAQRVNILSTPLRAYEACVQLSSLL